MKIGHDYSVRFLLRPGGATADGKTSIFVRITSRGAKDGFSLGIKVLPEKFDKKAQEIMGRSAEVVEQNRQLRLVRSELTRHYNSFIEKGRQVTPTILKNAYLGVEHETKTLLEAFDIMYALFEKRVAKEKMSAETVRKWKSYRAKLSDFVLQEFDMKDLPLDRVKLPFAESFFNFLTLDENLEDNTAMKYIKNTKQLLNFAAGREWIPKNPINSYKCSYIDPDRDILDADQLATLYHKEISVPRLQEAKDIYMFMAFTGYAYKDVLNLTPGHISKFYDGEDWIVKNREKTWCRENVPLLPQAKALVEKYKDDPYCLANGRLFPVRSNQRFNGYLKEIADICGIKKNLTTHTARHTFATTVTLANGVPLETVSALLGHKSIRTTQIYAKIVAAKVSKDMKALKDSFRLELPKSLFKTSAA